MCFDDILTLRIYIDTTPDFMSTYARDSIMSTFDLYINEKVPFNPNHLDLLKEVTNLEIVGCFFDHFLPAIFGMDSPRNKRLNKKRKKSSHLALSWIEKLELINSQNHEQN